MQTPTARKWHRLKVLTADCETTIRPERVHFCVSHNSKCGSSINVPIATTCTSKTPACVQYCYGLNGPCSMRSSIQTHVENQALLDRLAAAPLRDLQLEADYVAAVLFTRGQDFLRWNGMGELSLGAVRFIRVLVRRHPGLALWISTRNAALASRLPRLPNVHVMLSMDRTTSQKTLTAYRHIVRKSCGQAFLAYTRLDETDTPPLDVNVVFEKHIGAARAKWQPLPQSCMATVHPQHTGAIPHAGQDGHGACSECRRCFDRDRREATQFKSRRGQKHGNRSEEAPSPALRHLRQQSTRRQDIPLPAVRRSRQAQDGL